MPAFNVNDTLFVAMLPTLSVAFTLIVCVPMLPRSTDAFHVDQSELLPGCAEIYDPLSTLTCTPKMVEAVAVVEPVTVNVVVSDVIDAD